MGRGINGTVSGPVDSGYDLAIGFKPLRIIG